MSAEPSYLHSRNSTALAEPNLEPDGWSIPGRPPLRVLPGTRRRSIRLSRHMILSLAAATIFVAALAIVSAQALLAQGQFRLERLKIAENAAVAREQLLTFEVANLKAPQRIVSTAQHQLGMVVPSHVTYLASVPASTSKK